MPFIVLLSLVGLSAHATPRALTLSATDFVIGESAEITVDGLDPGESVTLLPSRTAGPGNCLADAPELCVDVVGPYRYRTGSANGSGRASWLIDVEDGGAWVPGAVAYLQAGAKRGSDDGSSVVSNVLTVVLRSAPEGARVVDGGYTHSCAVDDDLSVWCWGDPDSYGERSDVPTGEFQDVSMSQHYGCALDMAGEIACWGRLDDYGLQHWPLGPHVSVSAGQTHACAVSLDGTLTCWGRDVDGSVSGTPSGDYLAAAAGRDVSCAIHQDESISCWGADSYGQATPPGGSFADLSIHSLHGCAVAVDGALACWGQDVSGKLDAPGGLFQDVSVGHTHACAAPLDGGPISCWGMDQYGQSTPPVGDFRSVGLGDLHSCGVQTDGVLRCWGYDNYHAAPDYP